MPLRRRVAVRLAASIQDGELSPGERLPGVRVLAARLNVHRHTVAAAYRELADAGLVVPVSGGGTYVADPDAGPGPDPHVRPGDPDAGSQLHGAAEAVRRFLAAQRGAGRRAASLARLLARWRSQLRAGRLLLVEPEPGLRRLLLHELRRGLRQPVAALAPRALCREPLLALTGVPVGRAAVLRTLAAHLPPGADAVPLPLRGGARELRLVQTLPARSVVAVVTESALVRRRARELLAGYRDRGTGFLLPPPADEEALARALRIARLVFADALCSERPTLRECRRRLEVRLLAPGVLSGLAGWLDGSD